MISEHGFRRALPPRPYRPENRFLEISKAGIDGTVRLLQRAGSRESAVFWFGTRGSDRDTALYVVAPKQAMSWGSYRIDRGSHAALVQSLSEGWRILAQVHTHPGTDVEHSTYDDEAAVSTRALSLVFPSYARFGRAFPAGVGVHEHQDGYWHRLDADQAVRRVRIADALVRVEDLR